MPIRQIKVSLEHGQIDEALHARQDSRAYENARRIVNGTDRASTIADYARQFESAIRAGMAI